MKRKILPAEQKKPSPAGALGHECTICGKRSAGWGFKPPTEPAKWYCYEHRGEGEKYLKN